MAEPVSTALTVIAAFKEAYLISRFVYKTAKSSVHLSEEKKLIVSDFKGEVLYLKSFWVVFDFYDGKIVPDANLNEVSTYKLSVHCTGS